MKMRDISRNVYKWYEKNSFTILILLSALIAGSIFVTYGYQDLKSLTVWSLNLLDVIYEGRPYEYYAYCAENLYNLSHEYMGSGYLALIPWAVWNIPIWVLQRWFGIIAVGHAWTLLYSKMFLVVVEGIMLYYTYKITMHFTGDIQKSKMAAYLTFSSPFVLIGIYFTGQSDIISLCLFVIAIYKLLEKKRMWFIIFAALGIAAKPYVLLAYIAVILLMEKNIWKICAYVFAGGSVTILFTFLYSNAPMYKDSIHSGPTGNQLETLLSVSIDGGIGYKISLFVVAIVLFYFFLYIKEYREEREHLLVYFIAVTFLLFFILTDSEYYRMIYLAPFIYILFVYKENLRLNLLVELVAGICAVFVFYIRYLEFFSEGFLFQYIRDIVPNNNLILAGIKNELRNMDMNAVPICAIAASVYFAVMLVLAIVNYPDFQLRDKEERKLAIKPILWIRVLILVPITILSLFGN